ncbi:hypothetical protein TNCV_1751841 [Trichonephila clavipes]|nr:hypothetical protein TNCV_1751841 [Trichonephila clavipes]
MAISQQTDMDFTPQSPLSTDSYGTASTPCEELTAMKTYIRILQIICNEKEKTVSLLRLDHGHNESDTLYQLAWNEFQDVQGTLQQAVSDFDSLPPCTNPGCSHLISPKNTPNTTPPPSPTRRNTQLKRKDEEDFEFPPLRKTARKTILEKSEDINLNNQFSLLPNVIIKQQVTGQVAPSTATLNKTSVNVNENQNQGKNALPPPIMMRITKTYREQVDTMKKYFPHLRLKTTGEYIKLYSNTAEQNRAVKHTLKSPDKVTHLVGRRTKQKLPVFLVTLPRSIENLKNIRFLKILYHLNMAISCWTATMARNHPRKVSVFLSAFSSYPQITAFKTPMSKCVKNTSLRTVPSNKDWTLPLASTARCMVTWPTGTVAPALPRVP